MRDWNSEIPSSRDRRVGNAHPTEPSVVHGSPSLRPVRRTWATPRLRCATAFICLAPAFTAAAEVTARVGDLTSLKGPSINRLIGTGLVVGLSGTGDGDQYEITMRQLAQALGNLAAPVNALDELKDTKNVAIVMIDAVISESGAREGDRIDVHVSALGSAKSLAGGRLLVTPLMYQSLAVEKVFATASGPIRLEEPETLTVGLIEHGAVLHEDVLISFTALGQELPFMNDWIRPEDVYVTLVLDDAHAGWGLAVAIAETINAELSLAADVERVALAADPKNVVVWIPPFQRQDPASWIRDVEELSALIPHTESRLIINRSTGTIALSGDARISPVVVSQKGMTVVVRTPPPGPDEARVDSQSFVGLSTSLKEDAAASDLLEALNQLKVPIEDRIAILTEIQRAGKLHAKLIFKE